VNAETHTPDDSVSAGSNPIVRDPIPATMTTTTAPMAMTIMTTFVIMFASAEVPLETATALALTVATLAHLGITDALGLSSYGGGGLVSMNPNAVLLNKLYTELTLLDANHLVGDAMGLLARLCIRTYVLCIHKALVVAAPATTNALNDNDTKKARISSKVTSLYQHVDHVFGIHVPFGDRPPPAVTNLQADSLGSGYALRHVSGMGYRVLLRGRRWPAPGTLKLTARGRWTRTTT
jgi:hypothetical protein